MEYRVSREKLLDTLSIWNKYLGKKVRLIACGGTALTLLNLKDSTKDIDFIVPKEEEHAYLINKLIDLGYEKVTPCGWSKDETFIFDLFIGNTIYTTGLLESPLEEGNNIPFKEFSNIYIGILNYYDLIISKLFRCSRVDLDDCKVLFLNKREEIDMKKLGERFNETVKYDVSEERIKKNLEIFIEFLREEGVEV
ncbi:DUF6036 family nucleotidyltransferase [Acidobacteriota bacterium]